MQIGWTEFARYLSGAFALYLILEGIVPFINPVASQRMMARLSQADPRQLRWGGLVSMVIGLGMLWWARNG
jgi:uncharacterized protein YjeT (DUF2065 family)